MLEYIRCVHQKKKKVIRINWDFFEWCEYEKIYLKYLKTLTRVFSLPIVSDFPVKWTRINLIFKLSEKFIVIIFSFHTSVHCTEHRTDIANVFIHV